MALRIPHPPLDLHWVRRVLTSWDSAKSSTPEPRIRQERFFADKSFSFIIKTPPAAVQLLEAAKVKGGSAQPNRKKVASVTWDQVRAIAEDKMSDLNCFTVESAMKLIAGTARSMGITVKGDFPGK